MEQPDREIRPLIFQGLEERFRGPFWNRGLGAVPEADGAAVGGRRHQVIDLDGELGGLGLPAPEIAQQQGGEEQG